MDHVEDEYSKVTIICEVLEANVKKDKEEWKKILDEKIRTLHNDQMKIKLAEAYIKSTILDGTASVIS